MSKWDRFVVHSNLEIEKQLVKIVNKEKTAVGLLKEIPMYDLGMTKYEKWGAIVSVGALLRCSIALESMLVLLRNGYYGSMNALLRQVYEFIVWSKLSIDNTDETILHQLHDDFYDSLFSQKANVLGNYYKRIIYEIKPESGITEEEIIKKGKAVFSSYSYFTHASTISQQNVFKCDSFYENMHLALHEVGCWIVCFSYVIDSYLFKCNGVWEPFNDKTFEFNKPDIMYYSFINKCLDDSRAARCKVFREFENIAEEFKYKFICESKWLVKREITGC